MLATNVLFRSKNDFIAGVADGRSHSITLVDVGGWVIPEMNVRKGAKQTILRVEDNLLHVVDKNGTEGTLTLTGEWKFFNHRVQVLDGNTEFTYVVNPLW